MSRCPECGQTYSPKGGGHCRGGAYGGCCRTFTSDAAGDFHKVGPYEPRGSRVCVDVDDDWRVKRDGTRWKVPWRLTKRGWTPFPPREDFLPIHAERAASGADTAAGA
jgi:hypothetical protein